MQSNSLRYYGLLAITLLLLTMTVVKYWPHKSPRAGNASKGPGGQAWAGGLPQPLGDLPAFGGGMPPGLASTLEKMPPEKREAFETRMQADRAFFDSVRDLPEDQRRTKMQEYFKSNPPPSDFLPPGGAPPMGGPPGPPGGPGNGPPNGPMRLPDPSVRRGMDQQIANSQQK